MADKLIGLTPKDHARLKEMIRQIVGQELATGRGSRSPQKPPLMEWDGITVDEGPDGEADFTTNAYWVDPCRVSNEGGADEDPVTIEALDTTSEEAIRNRIIATNICEEENSHVIPVGSYVRIKVRYDQSDPPQPRFFFERSLVGSTVLNGIIRCCGPPGEDDATLNTYWVEIASIEDDDADVPIHLFTLSVIIGTQSPASFAVGEVVTQLLASGETASGIVTQIILNADDHTLDKLVVALGDSDLQFEIGGNEVAGASGEVVSTDIERALYLMTNLSENLDSSHTLWPGQYVIAHRTTDASGNERWEFEA